MVAIVGSIILQGVEQGFDSGSMILASASFICVSIGFIFNTAFASGTKQTANRNSKWSNHHLTLPSLLLAISSRAPTIGLRKAKAPRSRPELRESAGPLDPFRPERPPLEPIIINALQSLLEGKRTAAEVVQKALKSRQTVPENALTSEEETLFTRRVLQVDAGVDALGLLLESAVDATSWVAEECETERFGIGLQSDPLVQMYRAECMLAALILHIEGGTVNFLEDRFVDVLRDSPAPETVEALRAALATVEGEGL